MKSINDIFKNAILGIGIGTVVTFLLITAQGEFSPAPQEFIEKFSTVSNAVGVELIIFAILGVLQGYAGYIYFLFREKNIIIQYLVHYFFIILPIILAGYYLKWYTDLISLVSMIIVSSFIYFVILIFNILKIKNELKKINNKIEKYR